jgi:Ca2+/Na+ antiporter
VLAAEKLGCLLGINSFMMGLVVLAAGTSVPDALASLSVAKEGLGGMAVRPRGSGDITIAPQM